MMEYVIVDRAGLFPQLDPVDAMILKVNHVACKG